MYIKFCPPENPRIDEFISPVTSAKNLVILCEIVKSRPPPVWYGQGAQKKHPCVKFDEMCRPARMTLSLSPSARPDRDFADFGLSKRTLVSLTGKLSKRRHEKVRFEGKIGDVTLL